jgi:hypothetical protein
MDVDLEEENVEKNEIIPTVNTSEKGKGKNITAEEKVADHLKVIGELCNFLKIYCEENENVDSVAVLPSGICEAIMEVVKELRTASKIIDTICWAIVFLATAIEVKQRLAELQISRVLGEFLTETYYTNPSVAKSIIATVMMLCCDLEEHRNLFGNAQVPETLIRMLLHYRADYIQQEELVQFTFWAIQCIIAYHPINISRFLQTNGCMVMLETLSTIYTNEVIVDKALLCIGSMCEGSSNALIAFVNASGRNVVNQVREYYDARGNAAIVERCFAVLRMFYRHETNAIRRNSMVNRLTTRNGILKRIDEKPFYLTPAG